MRRLRVRGDDEPADAPAQCTGLNALAATATALADAAPGEVSAGYLADAASFSTGSMALVKTVPYVTAHAAGSVAGPEGSLEYQDGYHIERRWQSAWLAEHLELHTS